MKINNFIDHTILKAQATKDEVKKLCQEAINYQFATVCVNSCFLPLIVKELDGSAVKTCVVNNFPLGANLSEAKLEELKIAIENGAQEIDTVVNISKVQAGEWSFIEDELTAMVQVCNQNKTALKVILETCYLNSPQIIATSQICAKSRVHFIKTSTGFGTGGATIKDIQIIKSTIGNQCGIKASGGIKTYESCLTMIEAGATRIGTRSGVALVS